MVNNPAELGFGARFNAPMKRFCLRLVCMLFILIIPLPTFGEQFYCVKGKIWITHYGLDSTNKSSTAINWSFAFTCIVGTNRWRINTSYVRNATEEWYWDGTNVFRAIKPSLSSDTTEATTRIGFMTPGVSGPTTIYIYPSPDGHPLGNMGVNIPWLAFCSENYLRQKQRVVPLPVVDIKDTIDSLAYEDRTELLDNSFGLPRLIELVTSRSQAIRSLTDSRLNRSSQLIRARLNQNSFPDDGKVRFRYSVTKFTNYHGHIFPTEFAYTDYKRQLNAEWIPNIVGTGVVNDIETSKEPVNVLSPGTEQMIVDERFRHQTKLLDGIIYPWTNGELPSMEDPILAAKFNEKARVVRSEPFYSLAWIRVAMCVAIVLPLAYMLLARLKKKAIDFADKSNKDLRKI